MMNDTAATSVKCVLVGDSAVGKTSLLVRFTTDTFPEAYKPTVYENMGVEVQMDGRAISLGLWDTGGDDTFRQIRPMSYQQADVVLLCFSVANPGSLGAVLHKWVAEVRGHLPSVPVLVVGMQTDLRDPGGLQRVVVCITADQGRRAARQVRAKGYLECSALGNRGVKQVFECAVRAATGRARRHRFSRDQCKVI